MSNSYISNKDIVYISYCPKCKERFGHTNKTKANRLRKAHLTHSFEVEQMKPTLLTPEIETLIMENIEKW
jgi:hypothetical protein